MTAGVKVGICPQSTDLSMPVVDLARAAEERGFSSFFLCEHTHIPIDSPRSASPQGGEVIERHKRLWDPLVALAFVAQATSLEVGTAICLPAEHDAIAMAKAVATIDQMSQGRLVLGVGWGWHREELEDHGYAASERVAVLADKLALMKVAWTEEEPAYEGRYVRLSRSWFWPKPAQRPRPVLLGAPATERNFHRIASWADGWIPMATPLFDEAFPGQLAGLRTAWEGAGRQGEPVVMAMHAAPSADDLRRAVGRAKELGIGRLAIPMVDDDADRALTLLDAWAPALA